MQKDSELQFAKKIWTDHMQRTCRGKKIGKKWSETAFCKIWATQNLKIEQKDHEHQFTELQQSFCNGKYERKKKFHKNMLEIPGLE